jgi:hypothetical protein
MIRVVLICALVVCAASPLAQAQTMCEPTISRPCPAPGSAASKSSQDNEAAKRFADERKKRNSPNVDVKINGSVRFEGGTGGGTRF